MRARAVTQRMQRSVDACMCMPGTSYSGYARPARFRAAVSCRGAVLGGDLTTAFANAIILEAAWILAAISNLVHPSSSRKSPSPTGQNPASSAAPRERAARCFSLMQHALQEHESRTRCLYVHRSRCCMPVRFMSVTIPMNLLKNCLLRGHRAAAAAAAPPRWPHQHLIT